MIHSRRGSRSPEYAVGDRVEVLYTPGHPEDARLHDFISIWGITAGVAALSTIMVVVGIVLVYFAVTAQVDQLAREVKAHPREGNI